VKLDEEVEMLAKKYSNILQRIVRSVAYLFAYAVYNTIPYMKNLKIY
jgi:hypothetical protein